MRNLAVLTLWLLASLCSPLLASEEKSLRWEDRRVFSNGTPTQRLTILSSTDAGYLAPLISEFVAQQEDFEIEYLVAGTAHIYDMVRSAPEVFDIVISSAMDLQIKLVNDGFAAPLEDINAPDWSVWRERLFGFTAEPASIVINKAALAHLPHLETRQDLISLLRAHPDLFRGKIATYDIRRSGLGYLFASQDARTSETYWRLTEVMGSLGTRLYCCSGAMIKEIVDGDILVAYNVLGSYATAQSAKHPQLEVIVPSDFAITMMRTVFVSKASAEPKAAGQFTSYMLDHFASQQGEGELELPSLLAAGNAEDRNIVPLEPSLMINLDRLKRRAFTEEWESAIIQ